LFPMQPIHDYPGTVFYFSDIAREYWPYEGDGMAWISTPLATASD
jgi:hypothetical protein